MSHTILRTSAVIKKTSLARTTLHNLVKSKTFPAPIPLGGRAVGWIESEIDNWIEAKMKSRDGVIDGENDGEI